MNAYDFQLDLYEFTGIPVKILVPNPSKNVVKHCKNMVKHCNARKHG